MIEIRINGISYQAEEGKTILDIARKNGIDIPTLCYMEGVSDIGSCRLCAVEVEGFRNLLPPAGQRQRTAWSSSQHPTGSPNTGKRC